MSQSHVLRFESMAALRAAAEPWNDLWRRTESALPTGRAELIADWLEQFAPQGKLIALAVVQDGQFVAALPLLERKLARFVTAGSLPANDCCWAGHLLLDQSADVPHALATLFAEIRRLPWPLMWIDQAPVESSSWREFLAAAEAHNIAYSQHERFRIGTVQIANQFNHDWEAYEAAWSGNHRRHLRKAMRRAESEGGVELELHRPRSAQELESLLHEGFEVEHRSWKGKEGTSVLANPETWRFYLRQATELARWGELELAFLRYSGRAVAFEYGWSTRGVYYTPKVGFDDEYARFSPGQLLRYLLLKEAFCTQSRWAVDFLGPLADATAKWTTQTYPVARVVLATGGVGGRSLLWSYRNIAGPLRKIRNRRHVSPEFNIVSAEKASLPLPPVAIDA